MQPGAVRTSASAVPGTLVGRGQRLYRPYHTGPRLRRWAITAPVRGFISASVPQPSRGNCPLFGRQYVRYKAEPSGGMARLVTFPLIPCGADIEARSLPLSRSTSSRCLPSATQTRSVFGTGATAIAPSVGAPSFVVVSANGRRTRGVSRGSLETRQSRT